jgi:putative addiction module component (TIGR02574 family)
MRGLDTLSAEAMQLDVDARETLVHRLLQSLESLSEEDVERLWVREAERRLEAFRGGRVSAIPAEDVLEEAARKRA